MLLKFSATFILLCTLVLRGCGGQAAPTVNTVIMACIDNVAPFGECTSADQPIDGLEGEDDVTGVISATNSKGIVQTQMTLTRGKLEFTWAPVQEVKISGIIKECYVNPTVMEKKGETLIIHFAIPAENCTEAPEDPEAPGPQTLDA